MVMMPFQHGLYEDQYNSDTYVSSYDLDGTNNTAVIGAGLYQIGILIFIGKQIKPPI